MPSISQVLKEDSASNKVDSVLPILLRRDSRFHKVEQLSYGTHKE